MGDLQERLSVSSSSSSSSSSLSSSRKPPVAESLPIDGELWMIAEDRTWEILCTIQPVLVSDRSRIEIIDYVRNLIKGHHGVEVFSFGSVPLKTYLPDGDIDLTVLTHQDMEEKLAVQLCSMLEGEEKGSDIQEIDDFQATDVQYIRAQVKVIKCNIKNIAVDISFNQMAGLCALCFLEQIDQIFGRDHLFKRSIILIKAWCYYESRILGANTGLISTYALAVLVLYIINLFHSSLSGPLAVLYKFLDYYGSFDWDNYCVSVNGPVPISSLPEMNVSPEINGCELLLNEKFFRECTELYSVPTKGGYANGHDFPVKHLNVVDPLKHSNNLGRSVTKGNFQRVRHAFSLGARKLRDILTLPVETMGSRLEKFFANSLDRNGKGQRQDVHNPVTAFGTGRSELSELSGDFNGYYRSLVYGQWYHGCGLPGTSQHSWMPSTSQVQDTSAWDMVHRYVNSQKNEFYRSGLNGSIPRPLACLPTPAIGLQNMGKSRGTGTYIPDMSQSWYADRFRGTSTGNSLASVQARPLLKSSERVNGKLEASMVTRGDEIGNGCNHILEGLVSHSGNKEESSSSESYDLDQPLLKFPRAGNSFSSSGSSMNGTSEYSGSVSGRSSPLEKLVDPISSSASAMGDNKEEENGSSC
ncbi:PREDICTED: uncharacterized protein LOC104803199 isoform X2 [Tarenaya hassleriana]|uniref:uncharacterized protein LOC104803199 isoform X2 n=1 Tax=Tarenaya hassleriana TaxID=28532 RepID=UPI00053C8276|nr:PREDICTED: uncharacterized protein LOC104803199 isoform X2 [Tarenaya hassleriana]